MKNKQIVLFDMDGTINDSAEGIINGIIYMLNRHGITGIDRAEVVKYIGPPFRQTLIDAFGFSPDKAAEAHGDMREYMMREGMFINRVYDGIYELLKQLKAQNKTVGLATAKWIGQAEAILQHFKLREYFDFVGGADDKIGGKAEIIRHVLKGLGVTDKDKGQVVMVGDRANDLMGAKENGIDCIGVLYGYGTREELEAHNPLYIVETVEELTELLCR